MVFAPEALTAGHPPHRIADKAGFKGGRLFKELKQSPESQRAGVTWKIGDEAVAARQLPGGRLAFCFVHTRT